MFYFISLVTSVKDYIEIAHKLVESDVTNFSTYNDLGALFSYLLFSFKQIFTASNLWNLPIIIPDVASALISEVSILDTNWQNQIDLQLFSERSPFAAREIGNNIFREGVEKFSLGFINSFHSSADLVTNFCTAVEKQRRKETNFALSGPAM